MAWLSKLSGYKTYIISVGAIITAIGSYFSGSLDLKGMIEAIWAAVTAMTIRHGITTDVTAGTGKPV